MRIRINNQQSDFAKATLDRSAISNQQFAKGFSLMEVLLAVGTLAIGMLFIAGVFPVSIHFITVSSERTIAATAADEAFAKVMLLAHDPNCSLYAADFQNTNSTLFEWVANGKRSLQSPMLLPISPTPLYPATPPFEFAYPSTPTTDPYSKRYWWSAVCRRVSIDEVQVTVFVSRKVGATTTYLNLLDPSDNLRPVAIDVNVSATADPYELTIIDNKNLINDGYTIVDDATGQIYRVLERLTPPLDNRIRLDKPWNGASHVWVVPPPVGGGRYPCIAVYQKIMRF